MIRAYPATSSVKPGETLTLHVSTDQPQFRVAFYRQGQTLQLIDTSGWLPGHSFTDGAYDKDWGWLGYKFPIPAHWPTGVYVAMLYEGDSNGNQTSAPDVTTADGSEAKALFVIRSSAPGQSACILYKLPLFTYHAYNDLGGASLYGAAKVTLRRPGGGTGGNPWDSYIADVYDETSPRQSFAHWDAPFISWLESNGYAVDYCTDMDIHEQPQDFLNSYRLLLSVGHDEYWSTEMRQRIESFVAGGGNVAFFSANTCWWRVHLHDNNTSMTCDKSAHQGDTINFDKWYRINPENQLTGVSYRNGAGWWWGERTSVGYTVQHAKHWVYENTGLADADVFGEQSKLVGYECDGALFVDFNGVKVPTGTDGTPHNFVILGTGLLQDGWSDPDDALDKTGHPVTNWHATMGLYTNKGMVFTAATVDWARVLKSGNEPIVETITRNVLNRLKLRTLQIIGPLPTRCGKYVAVEGQTAQFHVDTSGLPQQGNLHYEWKISTGNALASNKPTFAAVMPSPPTPVTVDVTVTDGTDCVAFGTLSFIPLYTMDALRLELLCHLRTIASLASGHKQLLAGVRDLNQFFVDPLWDPIRFTAHSPFDTHDLRGMIESGQRLVSVAEKLLEMQREMPRERG